MLIKTETLDIIEFFLRLYKEEYLTFTQPYYYKHENLLNLRKLPVDVIFERKNYIQSEIRSYLIGLDNWLEFRRERYQAFQDIYNFRYRIKRMDTIIEKIIHNLKGHKYVSKILNDLFGERIILDNVIEQEIKIEALLIRLKEESVIYRYYYRSDGNYHAFHCYIQDENNHYPCEFQIWDSTNAVNNYIEHDRHEKERKKKGGS